MENNRRIYVSNYPVNSYTFTNTVPLYDSRSVANYNQKNYPSNNTNYKPYVSKYNSYKNIIGEGMYLKDLFDKSYYDFSTAVGDSVTSKLSSTIDVAKYLPANNAIRSGLFLFDSVGSISACMSNHKAI